MNMLRKIAQTVRHVPGLEGAEFIWRVLRPADLENVNRYVRMVDADAASTASRAS